MGEHTPGPLICAICGETGLSSIGAGTTYAHNLIECGLETADRLRAINAELVEALEVATGHLVWAIAAQESMGYTLKYIRQTSAALKQVRAAIAKTKEPTDA